MAGDEDALPIRRKALALARSFLGTPYRHQGSRAGIGCDCLGLVRGVWRGLYASEPEDPGAYTTDWSLRGGPDRMQEAAMRHLKPLEPGTVAPGDVVLFSWRDGAPATHCGILDEPRVEVSGRDTGRRLIHAYEGAAVVSSPLPPAWVRRIVGAFRFPE